MRARVEFEAVEVVAQYGVLRGGRREALLLGAHAPEHPKRGDEEMTGAAAWVHYCHFGCTFGPVAERASGRRALIVAAEVLQTCGEWRLGVTRRPPRSE